MEQATRKEMKISVKETNLPKLKAFTIAKSSQSISAKDYKGIPFKLTGYVKTENELITYSEATGEVLEHEVMDCISLVTVDNIIIGTNSPTLISNFDDILKLFSEEEIELSSQDLHIVEGQGKNGKYNTIELVL